jgi:LAO/AO transport system kinase
MRSPKAPGGRLAIDAYVEGVLAGDRAVLARAITLVESERADDAAAAAAVLDALLPHAGRSQRVGITGVPGVGKSTFIDALGMHLVKERGQRVAVLSVDPSSPLSGGSILGDKTRMERLALEPAAYIRPSPARGFLGGVARRTRETILLCEAAGFGTILVETVGVGQSETAVRSMTDFFLLLMLPGAGEYRAAPHLFPAPADGWVPPVLTCSALAGEGIAELWDVVIAHHAHLEANGSFARRRSQQALAWMRELVATGLETAFRAHPDVAAGLPPLESAVAEGRTTAFAAARDLLTRFRAS